jgi:manganese/iron transport system permease protein
VLLFGRVLDVDRGQIVATLVLGGLAAAMLVALHKELVLRAFDPSHAEASGYRIARLDFVLDVCVALVVVVAVRAVGTVLVIAFFVTPAATARLLRLSIPATMLAAAALAVALGWIGLSASYEASVRHGVNLAAGASIVALYTAAFALVGGGIALGRRVVAR